MPDVNYVKIRNLKKARKNRFTDVRRTPGERTKLIFVHGSGRTPSTYRPLVEVLLEAGPHDVYVFRYGSYLGSAERIAGALKREIRALLQREPEARLILSGHSLGGVLVRRATLDLFRDHPEDLARIDRLVLLSSTNRGFEPITFWQGIKRRVAGVLPIHPPILDGLRGSTWMTRLRIDWLETFGGVRIRPPFDEATEDDPGYVVTQADDRQVPDHPRTIQIDGDRDRLVRPDDSADLSLFEGWVEHIIMPGIGHFDFTLAGRAPRRGVTQAASETMAAQEPDPAEKIAALDGLARKIGEAVAGKLDPPGGLPGGPGFGLGGVPPADVPGPYEGWFGAGLAPCDINIIIMIHGIRDYGSWHPTLGEALEALLAGSSGFWRIVPIEYGFFSALQFLLPAQQQRVVHGFVDRYLNEVTRAFRLIRNLGTFVPVRIHIAAHSNGANILAQAIERDAEIFFSRVFLAGCVVRRDFWVRHPDRAFAVRNDCAAGDWPVGVLCRFLGKFPTLGYWFLGTAGVDGFLTPLAGRRHRFVVNSRWLTGDHGAAIEPARIDTVATYLVMGKPTTALVNATGPASLWRQWLVFIVAAVVIIAALLLILARLYHHGGGNAVLLGCLLIVLVPAIILIMLNI